MTGVSSVRFLRKVADECGGLDTVRGRGLHRAAGHLIMQQEELRRQAALLGADDEARVEAAAQGVYARTRELGAGQLTADQLPDWGGLDPSTRERFRTFGRAALGAPVVEPAADPEELV